MQKLWTVWFHWKCAKSKNSLSFFWHFSKKKQASHILLVFYIFPAFLLGCDYRYLVNCLTYINPERGFLVWCNKEWVFKKLYLKPIPIFVRREVTIPTALWEHVVMRSKKPLCGHSVVGTRGNNVMADSPLKSHPKRVDFWNTERIENNTALSLPIASDVFP